MPRMNLASMSLNGPASDNAPEPFTERILQARLASFWRHHCPSVGSDGSPKYDVMQSEAHYDEFCTQYLSKLPPAFGLQSDRQWDTMLPKLGKSAT